MTHVTHDSWPILPLHPFILRMRLERARIVGTRQLSLFSILRMSWRTQPGKNSSAYGLLASAACAKSVRSKSYSRPAASRAKTFGQSTSRKKYKAVIC